MRGRKPRTSKTRSICSRWRIRGCGFVYVRDGRTALSCRPRGGLLDRIRDLCGEEAAGELTAIEAMGGAGLKISGFIGKAGVSRSTRGGQRVFINGRAVENGIVNQALREGTTPR